MRASSSSGSRRFSPKARDLVSSAMNVENSREADPVRAEALAGPLRAALIDVALILSCIRAKRSKRRMGRQPNRNGVIVDWVSSATALSHATRARCLSDRFITEKETLNGFSLSDSRRPGFRGSAVDRRRSGLARHLAGTIGIGKNPILRQGCG